MEPILVALIGWSEEEAGVRQSSIPNLWVRRGVGGYVRMHLYESSKLLSAKILNICTVVTSVQRLYIANV